MRGSCGAGADTVDDRVAGNETTRPEGEKHGARIAKRGRATRQRQARNAKSNEQNRDLTRMAQVLTQEPDRDHGHDQRCDAPREGIDEAQIACLIGPI